MRFGLLTIILIGLFSCHKPDKFRPTVANTIYDSAGLLTKQQTDSIFGLINDLNSDVGSEIVLITIDTLAGQTIEDYSIGQAERLRIGRDKYRDGVLLTIAVKNRQIRIEVGYGLELIIKDEIATRIIRNVIAPRYRRGEYGRGIYEGLDSIKYLIERDRNLVGKSPKP